MTEERMIKVEGPPITEDLQKCFGHFGEVIGVGVSVQHKGVVTVQYRGGATINFVPYYAGGAVK